MKVPGTLYVICFENGDILTPFGDNFNEPEVMYVYGTKKAAERMLADESKRWSSMKLTLCTYVPLAKVEQAWLDGERSGHQYPRQEGA